MRKHIALSASKSRCRLLKKENEKTMKHKILVVEYERDGDYDNFEILEIEAETVQEAISKVRKPKSFINRHWGIRKVWSGEAVVFNGSKMFG